MLSGMFSDADTPGILAAATAAVLAVMGAFGGGIAYLLRRRDTEAAAQRLHEEKQTDRFEKLANRQEETARELFDITRKEAREMADRTMALQKETIQTMATVAGRVGELSKAIEELRYELSHKQDVPGRPARGKP